MKEAIHITDVTLRDGLQMQSKILSLDEKKSLFNLLLPCGYQRLEITSFVNPKWVPQFIDSEAFCKAVTQHASTAELMAFVPNEQGLERLLAFPIGWAGAFVATSEAFNRKNINRDVKETLPILRAVIDQAHAEKRKVRIYLSTVFGCPYEGKISDETLKKVFSEITQLGADEIALSDTIGVAVPDQVKRVLDLFLPLWPKEKTAMHFHNTYGLALSAIQTAFSLGIRHFDGATGGIGGCPYAKGASGNVATEEILYAFFREGHIHPAFEKIKNALTQMQQSLGLTLSSRLADILAKGGSWYGVH